MLTEQKLVVLGAGGVGKSSITTQFVAGQFACKYDPTIEDSYRKQIELDGKMFMLDILDTAGTEQFQAMRDLYMKNGEGFMLVYSVLSQGTFNDIAGIREAIVRVKGKEQVPMVLVGNKCDLHDQRVISEEQGAQKAREFGCAFIETSAKTMVNVTEAFHNLVREVDKASDTTTATSKQKAVKGKKKEKKNKSNGKSSCILL